MALPEITQMLLQSLIAGGAGQEPGRDPFSPTQAMAPSEAAPEEDVDLSGQIKDEMLPGFQDALKAEKINVDDAYAEKILNMLLAAGAAGGEVRENLLKTGGGAIPTRAPAAMPLQPQGPPPADPAIRSALSFQALAAFPQYNKVGSQAIGAMLPFLAPRMMGPLLEQQRAEAQQATQLKNAIEIAKTRQLGEKRSFEIEKLKAEADKLKAETREIGKGKNKLTYRTVGNTVRIYDAEGNILRVDQGPDKPEKPYKIDDGESIRSWGSFADFAAGEEPVRTVQKVPPGSAAERKDLADLYTNLTAARKRLRDNFNAKFIGPVIGKAITEMKTGGSALAQYKAQLKLKAYFATDAEMKQAIDYVQDLQQFKADLIMYYSKTQVPQHEEQMRQKHIPYETDLPESFVSALDATDRHIVNSIEHRERVMGRRIRPEFGDEVVKPPGGQFTGDPTTKPSGQLQDRIDKQMADELGNDLGF